MNVQEALDELERKYKEERKARMIIFFSNLFYSLRYGIKNILFWFPIIWKDRPFDHAYLYILMAKKLKSMEDFFLSDKTFATNSKRHGKNIKVARILCERLFKEDYSSVFNWRDWEYSRRQEKQDREYLFNLMKKHISGWWD